MNMYESYTYPSLGHLLKSISQKYSNLDDIVLDYINIADPTNEYLEIITNNFNIICFASDGFSKKFIEKIDFKSKERIEILKKNIGWRYSDLNIKIISSDLISFEEAENLFFFPPQGLMKNESRIASGISILKRTDCSSESELKIFHELEKLSIDLYSYLQIFRNYFFKNNKSIDFLFDSIIKKGISSNTRMIFIKNFLEHPQSNNQHKILFLEALSNLKNSVKDHSSYLATLDETYDFIKKSLNDDSISYIAKHLW